MARTVSLLLSAPHSADLQGVIEDRGRQVKHVQRGQIILLSAERLPILEIAKRLGTSWSMVWRWQQRFAEEGIGHKRHSFLALLADCPPRKRAPRCRLRPSQGPQPRRAYSRHMFFQLQSRFLNESPRQG